tara:strand:- start:32456 stop:32749 length:294 start_codon:yes stop_codon:yes gene_type:complete
MKRLLVAALLLAMPAHAQPANKQWGECVADQLRTRDLADSANWNGAIIAARCKTLFHGTPGADVETLVKILKDYQETGTEPFTVGPSESLPPIDKKM